MLIVGYVYFLIADASNVNYLLSRFMNVFSSKLNIQALNDAENDVGSSPAAVCTSLVVSDTRQSLIN